MIEPHYPKGEGGRPAYPLMAMLRVHLMQNWFGYSDPAMEEALYERRSCASFQDFTWTGFPMKRRFEKAYKKTLATDITSTQLEAV